jgi:hypothetical protein
MRRMLLSAYLIGLLLSGLCAQDLEVEFKPGAVLSQDMLAGLGAFDTLAFPISEYKPRIDTATNLSDSILFVLFSFDRDELVIKSTYLMSVDRGRRSAVALLHLSDNPTDEGYMKRYRWTSNSIDRHRAVWQIEYKTRQWVGRTKGKVKETKAWRQRSVVVDLAGRISVGEWERMR